MAQLPERESSLSSSLSQHPETTASVKGNALIINNLGLKFKGKNTYRLLNTAQAIQQAKVKGFKEYSNTHLWEWTLTVGTKFLLKDKNAAMWRELNIYIYNIYIYMYIFQYYMTNILFVCFLKYT